MQPATLPHICFVAPAAWPVLSGDRRIGSAGGAEVQQCFLARGFVERGYRVSMICMDYGQPDSVVVHGITVYRSFTRLSGLPLVRFFHPRLTGMWSALKRANADIYYQRCAGANTGVVALFARLHRRKLVYAVACDLDVARDGTWKLFRGRGGWRDRQLYFAGLKAAHAVVAQHAGQVANLRRWYGREASIVPSCYTAPSGSHASPDGVVLWVSVLRTGKRPQLFLEMARRLPHIRFRLVGGPSTERGGEDLFARVQSEAKSLPNVEFLGFVPYSDIEAQFDAARLLVNTSDFEGFPNTFLQAWARGIPTVSFCDTGSEFDGGPVVTTAKDLDDMVRLVEQLMRDDARWHEIGNRVRACMEARHTPAIAVAGYQRVFESLLDPRGGRGGAPTANRSMADGPAASGCKDQPLTLT